jgi:septum site-determining protein MinC
MLDTKVIQITGRGTNVNFVIDDSAPIEEVTRGLHEHLREHRSLYSKGTITVNVGKRLLEREELTQIKETLEKESGVTVSRFWCPPHLLEEALTESIGFGVSVSVAASPTADDAVRSQARESRKVSYLNQEDHSGLEQWVAYVLDRPPAGEEAEATTAVPTEATVSEESAAIQGEEEAPVTEDSEGLDQQQSLEIVEPSAGQPARTEEHASAPPSGEKVAEQGAAVPSSTPVKKTESKRETAGLYRNNETLLIKTTCRSGEVIRHPGDVVVMADINPGAEVIADGDILVFGSLRGLAHAGASGDIQATIIALNLETHRLQIGPYTGVAPKSNKRSKSNKSDPRMAFVRRRSVYVAPYAGRFAGYSGGTLYDG